MQIFGTFLEIKNCCDRPAWSFDDRKIINKVLGDIFYKHIHCISGSGFWNPIFDMIWHCVLHHCLTYRPTQWVVKLSAEAKIGLRDCISSVRFFISQVGM